MIKVRTTAYLEQKKAKLEAGIEALQVAKADISSVPIIEDLTKAEKHLKSLVGELKYHLMNRELDSRVIHPKRRDSKRIQRIKEYRKKHNCSLVEAKLATDIGVGAYVTLDKTSSYYWYYKNQLFIVTGLNGNMVNMSYVHNGRKSGITVPFSHVTVR